MSDKNNDRLSALALAKVLYLYEYTAYSAEMYLRELGYTPTDRFADLVLRRLSVLRRNISTKTGKRIKRTSRKRQLKGTQMNRQADFRPNWIIERRETRKND
jgi:hypothetical protein